MFYFALGLTQRRLRHLQRRNALTLRLGGRSTQLTHKHTASIKHTVERVRGGDALVE